MPVKFLRALAGSERTRENNRRLGCSLAFVAGAINAGGFLAVGQYTSHMSGILSALAGDAVLGKTALVMAGLSSLLSFAIGAAMSAVLINWGRRRHHTSLFAAPLMFEAILLLCFGVTGSSLGEHRWLTTPMTVILLCFVMGLQNAIITKISHAEIRTTHVTGLVTDIGIELGKLLYWNRVKDDLERELIIADRAKLKLLTSLLAMFFLGALSGVLGFSRLGFIMTLPLAGLLMTLACIPIMDDFNRRRF